MIYDHTNNMEYSVVFSHAHCISFTRVCYRERIVVLKSSISVTLTVISYTTKSDLFGY